MWTRRLLIVSALARGVDHPRWLYVLPNGHILVANSDTIHRFPYVTGQSGISAPGTMVAALPAGTMGMAWEPESGALWGAVNERDELGSDLVPDYMPSVRDGGFYGWLFSYFGGHVDGRVKPQRPDLVASAIVPDYALGPHTASLGR